MDLSEAVNNTAGLKAPDVDKTNMSRGSSALMTLETAENVDLKHEEKPTRKKKNKDKKPKKFSISEAVMEYLETVKEPNGAVVESILDYLQSRYKVNKHLMKRNVVRFLQTAVQNGVLEQDSGTGDVERFKIKKVDIAKTGKKQMKGKVSIGVNQKVKLSNSYAHQLKETEVERTAQRTKNKKFDTVEEDEPQSKGEKKDDVGKSEQQSSIKKKNVGKIEQQFKIENKVVEKNKQKMKTKRVVVKKDEQKLKAREDKKIKNITQRLKNSDVVKKDKQQPKFKKADGKINRQRKKAAGIKEKKSVKKPKRKNSKK